MSHILIIDSDQTVAQALADALTAGRGDHVTIALGESAGLAAVERLRPNLVLLRFSAADFDGYDVLLKLRERYAVPALFHTLSAQDLPAADARLAHMLYLPAELDLEELLAARDDLIRRGANERLSSNDYGAAGGLLGAA